MERGPHGYNIHGWIEGQQAQSAYLGWFNSRNLKTTDLITDVESGALVYWTVEAASKGDVRCNRFWCDKLDAYADINGDGTSLGISQ